MSRPLLLIIALLLTLYTIYQLNNNNKIHPPTKLHPFEFTAIPGFFIQDQPNQHPEKFKVYHPDSSFGLIDKNSPDRWINFKKSIDRLINQYSPHNVHHKVIFIARHGQGLHNVAESKYGTTLWDCHWSEMRTDGELVWGPDARLTGQGQSEARVAHQAWMRELQAHAPFPQLFVASPLSRAVETMFITGLCNLTDYNKQPKSKIVIKEHWRENIGLHTCDQRRSKQEILEDFEMVEFENGFNDQDELWTKDFQETDRQLRLRINRALTSLFLDPISANLTYISITAHSGVISALLDVVGHQSWPTETGGMIPLVVRASPPKTPTALPHPGPSATKPACPPHFAHVVTHD